MFSTIACPKFTLFARAYLIASLFLLLGCAAKKPAQSNIRYIRYQHCHEVSFDVKKHEVTLICPEISK